MTTLQEFTTQQQEETWPDNGEQGHDGCLFQAGSIPAPPIVSASIWVRRSDGVFFFVTHATRQSAVDYLESLNLPTAIPDYTTAANLQYAVAAQLPQMFMGASPIIQVILVKGTTPPPEEQMRRTAYGTVKTTKTIVLKPTQLMTFINMPWQDIATAQIEGHMYKLV